MVRFTLKLRIQVKKMAARTNFSQSHEKKKEVIFHTKFSSYSTVAKAYYKQNENFKL